MFEVRVKRPAEKSLLKVRADYRKAVFEILDELKTDPIPYKTRDVRRLEGYKNHFRIRKGKIRSVYELSLEDLRIVVHEIDFRGNVY